MTTNTIGSVPEFTTDETLAEGTAQVDSSTQAVTEEVIEEEKVTPAEPAAAETPGGQVATDDTKESNEQATAVLKLQDEREKLLKEIQSLRGQRRELKKEELVVVDKQINELNDVNPADASIIEKVIRAKGFITKDEASQMQYKAVEQDEVNKFLEKYPEYKPENDPHDLNWSALQRELSLYRKPGDPRTTGELLSRAHRAIVKVPSDRSIPEKRQQIKVASVGSGGAQRSSPTRKSLDAETVIQLRNGGFSDEDIKAMESRL